jgi:DNA-binding CsgD family transcriptional regulator
MKPTVHDEAPAAPDALPLFYGEDDLMPVDDPRAGGTPGVVCRLLAAGNAAQREQLVRGLLHDIGFDWLAYGTVQPQRQGALARSFLTTYAHAGWSGRYFGERYHEVDPRHQDVPRSGLPLVWDLDDIDASAHARPASVRARRFLDELHGSGIGSGVFFQLASPAQPHLHTVISLMSSRRERRWIVDDVLGQALTLGLCLHEFLTRHVQRREATASLHASLSPLQQNILQCLSRGQSDKEIAWRLQLSSHTVDYHMRQLRRRFAVRNRVQLANAAT